MTDALDRLRDEAIALVQSTPELAAFAPLPKTTRKVDLPPNRPASVDRLLANPGRSNKTTAAFTAAALEASALADWRQTYTEEQVGADFLARYGWMELWGPTGHFQCDDARAYVAFWGERLDYAWHWHEAEEIYFVAAGAALFKAENEPDAMLSVGQTRSHLSNQPHAMITGEDPILTLVLWRGPGLSGVPVMPQ